MARKCSQHKSYSGVYRPRKECEECWSLYDSNQTNEATIAAITTASTAITELLAFNVMAMGFSTGHTVVSALLARLDLAEHALTETKEKVKSINGAAPIWLGKAAPNSNGNSAGA